MTRYLTNEPLSALTSNHLEIAKEILRKKFIIGTVNEIQVSFERFKAYFGWASEEKVCEQNQLTKSNTDYYIGEEEKRLLKEINEFDIKLYSYAEKLFQEQGKRLFRINKH